MNRLSDEKRVKIIQCLVEGNSQRATARIVEVSRNTVARLLSKVGARCDWYMFNAMTKLPCKRIEADEIWSFVGMKEKRVPREHKRQPGYGDAYTWIAFDPVSKLVPCYLVGRRDTVHAKEFMDDLSWRLPHRIQLTTDGHDPYVPAVEDAFGGKIDYAMLVKEYGGVRVYRDGTKKKCTASECSNIVKRVISGNPDPKHISTSMVERHNLTMRMSMRRFTRETNGFSKKLRNLKRAVALYVMCYNFARIHKTLRVTPAMEAGLAKHIWTFEEIANLAPVQAPKERGPYKKRHDLLQKAA